MCGCWAGQRAGPHSPASLAPSVWSTADRPAAEKANTRGVGWHSVWYESLCPLTLCPLRQLVRSQKPHRPLACSTKPICRFTRLFSLLPLKVARPSCFVSLGARPPRIESSVVCRHSTAQGAGQARIPVSGLASKGTSAAACQLATTGRLKHQPRAESFVCRTGATPQDTSRTQSVRHVGRHAGGATAHLAATRGAHEGQHLPWLASSADVEQHLHGRSRRSWWRQCGDVRGGTGRAGPPADAGLLRGAGHAGRVACRFR